MLYLRIAYGKPTLILKDNNNLSINNTLNKMQIIKYLDLSLIGEYGNLSYWIVDWPLHQDDVHHKYIPITEDHMMEYL